MKRKVRRQEQASYFGKKIGAPSRPGGTPPASQKVQAAIPGEFERQEALVFGAGQLVAYYPQVFVDFVSAAFERIKLIGVLDPKYRQLGNLLLVAAGLPADAVEFVEGETSSVWARDWSPFVGYGTDGKRCQFYVDRSHMRHRDDEVSRRIFTRYFGGSTTEVPISMEGGNFLSNGCGLILTSLTVPQTNAARHNHQKLSEIFMTVFGSQQWAALPPLHAERTGHVDLFATFLAADLLVIGSANEQADPINFRGLNDAADKLNNLSTAAGNLRVERIPMPSSKDSYFRSYNNVIFANGVLFVPSYPEIDPKLDQRVLGIYREFLPGWEVIGIDMRALGFKGGGLHCLSVNVPPLHRTKESAVADSPVINP